MTWLEKILEIGEAYAVGGSVRDEMLGRDNNDLDILVCGVEADRLQEILESEGKVHLVGKNFGVFVFKPSDDEASIEIALPRREKSTGLGHKEFDVQVDPDIPVEEDLKRRDFTINAMARSLRDQGLVDPYGGQEDLSNKVLKQVFDETFKEDPLRMLRACQFVARLDFTVEAKTFEGMKEHASLVNTVSAERVFHELEKLLKAKKPSLGFQLMQQTGLLKEILPELEATVGVEQPKQFHIHPVFEHILAVIDAAEDEPKSLRWAALCHDLGKPPSLAPHPKNGRPTFFGHEKISQEYVNDIFERLKAPDHLRAKVAALVREHMFLPAEELSDKALRRLIQRVGRENIIELIYLRRADKIGGGVNVDLEAWKGLLERCHFELEGGAFSRSDLEISGKDLMQAFDLKPGPGLGQILDQLLEEVIQDPALNQREGLLKIAEGLL
jgi:tRNA nucleotidyltransferase (CCA-adding enzyme)